MKCKEVSLFLLSVLIFQSCDPLKVVEFRNKSGKNIEVKVHQNAESALAMDKLEVYEFELKKKGDEQTHLYLYSIGAFSKPEVDSFKTMVKGLYLRTEDDSCLVEGKVFNRFLPKRRRGFFRNVLRVKIYKCPKSKGQ